MKTDRRTKLDHEAVARANADLSERLFREGVSITYDEDGDTLLIDIGEGGEAIADHVVDGLYIRLDPLTLKVVGCTAIGFASDALEHNRAFRKLFQGDFDHFRGAGGKGEWRGAEAQRVTPLFGAALSHRL